MSSKKQDEINPFQWFEDEFKRGSPILTIERNGKSYFVNWDGTTGRFDYRHFAAAHDCQRFDAIFKSLFETLRDTKFISDKAVIVHPPLTNQP